MPPCRSCGVQGDLSTRPTLRCKGVPTMLWRQPRPSLSRLPNRTLQPLRCTFISASGNTVSLVSHHSSKGLLDPCLRTVDVCSPTPRLTPLSPTEGMAVTAPYPIQPPVRWTFVVPSLSLSNKSRVFAAIAMWGTHFSQGNCPIAAGLRGHSLGRSFSGQKLHCHDLSRNPGEAAA